MVLQMSLAWPRTWNLGLGFLLLAQTSRTYASLAVSFCSPDLTAGDFQAVYDTFQSNGACQSTCQGYAYLILQGSDCWCSNYAPADQVSTYSCNTVCPGWQLDWCGNTQEGLYGYFQLPGSTPSGTADGSSPTSGSSSSSSSSRTSTSTAGPTSVVPVVVSDDPDPSSTSNGRNSITRGATSSPTQIYTSITTVTGQVRTILVTPTPTSDSTANSGSDSHSSGGGVSAGEVAGIVIGVALALGLMVGLGVWICLRRRHQRNLELASVDNASSHRSAGIPSRQVSQMSSAGLLSKGPRILTSGLPTYNNPQSATTTNSTFDRRSVGTDQRLNPYAIYAHEESRHSNVSLQDNQDYSRQLRVANPDP